MSGRGRNTGLNAPLLDQDTSGYCPKHTEESIGISSVGSNNCWRNCILPNKKNISMIIIDMEHGTLCISGIMGMP